MIDNFGRDFIILSLQKICIIETVDVTENGQFHFEKSEEHMCAVTVKFDAVFFVWFLIRSITLF